MVLESAFFGAPDAVEVERFCAIKKLPLLLIDEFMGNASNLLLRKFYVDGWLEGGADEHCNIAFRM